MCVYCQAEFICSVIKSIGDQKVTVDSIRAEMHNSPLRLKRVARMVEVQYHLAQVLHAQLAHLHAIKCSPIGGKHNIQTEAQLVHVLAQLQLFKLHGPVEVSAVVRAAGRSGKRCLVVILITQWTAMHSAAQTRQFKP